LGDLEGVNWRIKLKHILMRQGMRVWTGTELAPDRNQWQDITNAIINFLVL
jgi:hypothetical protein